jgi:hypothetical protein
VVSISAGIGDDGENPPGSEFMCNGEKEDTLEK